MVEPSRLALTSTPSIGPSSADDTMPVSVAAPCAIASGGAAPSEARAKAAPIMLERMHGARIDISSAVRWPFVLFYFASSTRVVVAGPSPTISRIASSSLAPSQCTCLPKWVTKVPAGIATVWLVSNLLPEPTHQVPLITVMKRSLGWKCGRLKLPGSHLVRTAYMPGFVGSPTSTAVLAPDTPSGSFQVI